MATTKFTESEQNLLLTVRDTYRNIAMRWIERRRAENQGLPLPPDVEERRKENDAHSLEKHILKMQMDLEKVKANTEDVPWLSKFVANIFKSGGGEAEKKYPSRRK